MAYSNSAVCSILRNWELDVAILANVTFTLLRAAESFSPTIDEQG
jgi:hypothetical protein